LHLHIRRERRLPGTLVLKTKSAWCVLSYSKFHLRLRLNIEVQYKSPWMVINILLANYSILIDDYKPNQTAKDIMNKLLIDIIIDQLFSILESLTTIQGHFPLIS
jgi:hypothetical protein